MTGIIRQHSVVGLNLPAQEAIHIARRVLAAEGYQSVAVGPTAATFVRDVRPPLGISLLSALSRSQEQCNVSAETSRRGTALSLSGVVTTRTLQELESALRQVSDQRPPLVFPEGDDTNRYPTPSRGAAAQRSGPPTPPPSPVTPPPPARSSAPAAPAPKPASLRDRKSGAIARDSGAIARNSGAIPRNSGSIPRDSGAIPRGSGPLPGQAPLPSAPLPPPPPPATPARAKSATWPTERDQSRSLPPPPLSAADLHKRTPPRPPDMDVASDLTVVRSSPLAVEPAAWASSAPPAPRWVIILDDGRSIDIPDFALIGRDPEPAEDDPEAGLVSLIDPEMSVSKTHASFGVDDEGLWFLDRYSTNGTSVQPPGGERVGLEPGVATPIPPGSQVWIGRRHLRIDRADG